MDLLSEEMKMIGDKIELQAMEGSTEKKMEDRIDGLVRYVRVAWYCF